MYSNDPRQYRVKTILFYSDAQFNDSRVSACVCMCLLPKADVCHKMKTTNLALKRLRKALNYHRQIIKLLMSIHLFWAIFRVSSMLTRINYKPVANVLTCPRIWWHYHVYVQCSVPVDMIHVAFRFLIVAILNNPVHYIRCIMYIGSLGFYIMHTPPHTLICMLITIYTY